MYGDDVSQVLYLGVAKTAFAQFSKEGMLPEHLLVIARAVNKDIIKKDLK